MANKNFKARIGIEAPLIAADNGTTAITLSDNDVTVVGDLTVTSNTIKSSSATAITLSGADVAVAGTLDVQGGTITDSTGALTISTGASDGAITLDPNGTGDVILTFANGGNLTNSRNYVYGAVRNATTETNGDAWSFTSGAGTGYRGATFDNSIDTTKRVGVVLRSYGVSSGAPRNAIIVENARGTAASPSGVTSADRLLEIVGSGYVTAGGTSAVSGWATDLVANFPSLVRVVPAENWDDGINKVGTRFQVILQPPSTTFTTGSSVTVLNAGTDFINYNSDAHNFKTKAGGNNLTIDVSGNVVITGDLTVTGENISTGVTNSIIEIDRTTTGTNDLARALVLKSTSTGTPTVGFGTALGFSSQTDATTFKDAGFISVQSTDVTTGSEDFSMNFGLMTAGATFSTKVSIDSLGNLTTNAGSSIINGTNRFTSPTVYAFTGSASPYRGLMISNGNGSSAAPARSAIVMRTFPVSGGSRGGLIFENSRGTETTPTAIQNNDSIGENSAVGYATNGWTSDYIAAVPGVSYFVATENWANSGGPYPTAGTVTNAGTGYVISLQPTATSLAAANASRVNVLNINPQTFGCRSDQYTWNKGKTNNALMGSLGDDGSGKIGFSVNQTRATTANEFALVNFNTQRSDGTNYTPTQNNDYIGSFKFNGNANTSTSPGVPGGPGAEIFAKATETWSNTANGTKFSFFAIKTGTIDSYEVISGTPDEIKLSAVSTTIKDYDGATTFATIDANTAKFSVPVTTEITTTTINEGTTYTPAATVDNNISVQINALAGGTTVFDLASLTGNSRGASYNILVYNNTGSGAAIQVKNTRINTNNLMTHTITTGSPRIIINAYVVGDYATADHFVVA
jgi:hypothetical protein